MKRTILSVGLAVLLILTLNFLFLPKVLHEILGMVLLCSVGVHLYQNRGWVKGVQWRSSDMIRRAMILLNIVIALDFVLVMTTGILISSHLFSGLIGAELQRNILLHELYKSAEYFFLVLSGAAPRAELTRTVAAYRVPLSRHSG